MADIKGRRATTPDIHVSGMGFMLLVTLFATSVVLGARATNDTSPVTYYLTKENEVLQVNLTQNIDKMDNTLTTHFIVHGWTEDANRTHYIQMAAALLILGPCNVIRVDYSPVADLDYLRAYISVDDVASIISKFIMALVKSHNFKLDLIHLIGHSMGGQVVGLAGRAVIVNIKQKVGWITALDPARPGYEFPEVLEDRRLTKDDATFVGIIHTDAGGYGYRNPAGHIDFFVNKNGERLQPGCPATPTTDVTSLLISVLDWFSPNDDFCSHHRSYMYYTESMTTKTLATKCDSYENFKNGKCNKNQKIIFGIHAIHSARGQFYLNTRSASPFLIPSS